MSYKDLMFSVNEYDSDGDVSEFGIFLHFDDVKIKVSDSIEEFSDFIKHLQSIDQEIKENWCDHVS